jgi:acyl CoA:acetate/3-ketoacid CoA transferase beta subunit
VVSRVYTDLAVLEADREAGTLVVVDLAPGIGLSARQEVTGAPVRGAG